MTWALEIPQLNTFSLIINRSFLMGNEIIDRLFAAASY